MAATFDVDRLARWIESDTSTIFDIYEKVLILMIHLDESMIELVVDRLIERRVFGLSFKSNHCPIIHEA